MNLYQVNNESSQAKSPELISVIVPAYGVEKYIGKCLESIINQTYKKLEIIVIDDGSIDKSGQIAESYAERDPRIHVYHKKNGGLSDARNFGIRKAHGEYITCIDSDDYVDDDYVEYLFETLKKYSANLSFCQHKAIFPSGDIKDYGSKGTELLDTEKCIERIMYDDILNTSAWGKLYATSLFSSVEYPVGMLYEDIGTTYKLLLQEKKIAIGYESKYNYILRSNSIVNGKFNPNKFDLLTMTDQMAINVEKVYPSLKEAVLRRRVYARFSTLNQMLDNVDYEDEKLEIIKFIKKNQKQILLDTKTPFRDKAAIILLDINHELYRFVWKKYLQQRALL